MGLKDALGALLGISAYQRPPVAAGFDLDDPRIERMREALGGQLSPLPITQTRWYLKDLETAVYMADAGDLSQAALLYRSFRRDGTLGGLLSTRTSGLVRLPKRFRGVPEVVQTLEQRDGAQARSLFEDMFPSAEIALLAADGICLGVGVGELVPVEGRDFPVFVRLDPAYLRYRWIENRWYYVSVVGLLPITPGDGRWVLHVPGGRMAPWQTGQWQALGESWINKSHAKMHRANFSAKLANPARVATTPSGANEEQRTGFLRQLMAWGVNTVFDLPPGYDAKLLESNGRGYEVFEAEIATSDQEIMIALAGQTVTTDGGTGFANADIHKSIRADLIKETADALSYTLNTQGIPSFVVQRFGLDTLLEGGAVVEWDVEPAKDRKQEADSLKSFGDALTSLSPALREYGLKVDIGSLATRFGVPIAQDSDGDGVPDVNQGGDPAEQTDDPENPEDEPEDDQAVETLAEKMTEHGIAKCEHGHSNRCWKCGVERVRDFDVGDDGAEWKVAWRPIRQAGAVE